MSFKSWLHNDYLKEEAKMGHVDQEGLDPEAQVPQQEMPADKVAPQGNGNGSFGRYFQNGNMKTGLQQLGKDIGDALYNFAIKTYVSNDMFDSEDTKLKYETEVRNKIAEDYNLKLIEVLRNAGIFLANAKEKYTK